LAKNSERDAGNGKIAIRDGGQKYSGDCGRDGQVAIIDYIERTNRGQAGQGMVEYVIVAAAVVAGAIATNSLIIPPLNDLYELMACMFSIPFP
jgi:hypothetical protein